MRREYHTSIQKQNNNQCRVATLNFVKTKKVCAISKMQNDGYRSLGSKRCSFILSWNVGQQLQPTFTAILRNKLRYAIQNIQEKLLFSVILLHDVGCPRTAAKIKEKIQDFRWKLFDHSTSSLKLAPSDPFLFFHLTQWFGEQRLETYEELKYAVVNKFNDYVE